MRWLYNKFRQATHKHLPHEQYAFGIRRFDRQQGERIHTEEFALKLGKGKDWYRASMAQFEDWAGKANIPWRAIKPHLLDTLDKARSLWPDALKNLPTDGEHKAGLREHWHNLHPDFRIEVT